MDSVRPLAPGVVELPAHVRDIVLDGPSDSDNEVAWISMPSGVHRFVMDTGAISHSGLLAFPGLDGASVVEADNVHTIHPTGDEILVGSEYVCGQLLEIIMQYMGFKTKLELLEK